MKTKFSLLVSALLLCSATIWGQATNRALSFTPQGYVDCGPLPAINGLSSYSLQFWLNPSSWTEGAALLSRGDDFKISLGAPGSITVSVGGKDFSFSADELTAGDWSQVTVICDNGDAKALVNSKQVAIGSLGAVPEDNTDILKLGGNYSGLLDEIRIWDDALNELMEKLDYFTFNTLNKWNPMWNNLVVYYKMDQEKCQELVDYKGIETPDKEYDNHGILSEGVTRVVADNDKMPYLVNAAYTENSRFFDRIIPRDQYLLSNEIIILGANCVAADGHVVPRTPNNHATLRGDAGYMSAFEGREGVLALNGSGYLEAPAATLNKEKSYMFETWIYLDEWTPGAYLVRKENDDKTHGLAIMLGEDKENPTLSVRVDGSMAHSLPLPVELKKWIHLGVNPAGRSNGKLFGFYVDGESFDCNQETTEATAVAFSESEELPVVIGEGIKGKLDETCLWNRTWSINETKNHITYIPLPALDRNVAVDVMGAVGAYYRYDRAEEPGFSYHSQDNWADIMRSAYDGHVAPKISISVRGHGVDTPNADDYFVAIMNNTKKRATFAADLAEMSKHYDGVELDLEWVYDANGWSNYSRLADEIIKALPEGKTFRISNHNVTYAYPVAKISDEGITGFTVQQYGPQQTHFNFNTFKQKIQDMIKYGYPPEKIVSSYSTTTSNGSKGSAIKGVRGGIYANYEGLTDANIESYVSNGETFYFMGPMQVYNRAKYTREQKLQGIFYWDMGNDYWEGTPAEPVMPEYHSARFCSYGINANTDTIVDKVNVRHFSATGGVSNINTDRDAPRLRVYPSPATSELNVALSSGDIPSQIAVYSLSGSKIITGKDTKTIDVTALASGIYMITVSDSRGKEFHGKFIKR